MVLAEAISIDPGVVVLILAVLLLLLLAAAAIAVAGVVAGVRSGRDPARTRATAVWAACLAAESALLVAAIASTDVLWIGPTLALVALTASARPWGRRRRG